ncbi:MAG: ABC transporter ATP-binding protein [Alphaproteobacteria bacterium]
MTPTDLNDPATAEMLGLNVRNARLSWGDTVFLDGFSFSAPAGSWTCLLGESGVGKSTLLRVIAGLIEPAAPTEIRAHDGSRLENRVAYMAQQDLLLPWLSAAENVALGARLRGERANRARTLDILDRAGVAGRANALPSELSGGERQRVALARTLMEERPIVLMDEPFSALDAITRTRLQDLAVELLVNRTVLMVTHDPFEALRLADGIFVLTGGMQPADASIVPPGLAPRDPTDPALRDSHHRIMQRLTGNTAQTTGDVA